tara:strand:- start:6357 stop:6764 length:408 start_codon:yes stop_codon:yes gene_type:complete
LVASKIVELARECLGTPYIHQGRHKGVGLDCAGLVAYVLDGLKLPYNDMKGYPRTPYDGMLKKALDNEPSLERVYNYEQGCVLLLRITKDPQHLAIYAGHTIIHSYLTAKKVTEHGFSDSWRRKVVGIYRIKINE